MATQFDVELSMQEPPEEAQARAATALKDPAHAIGLRLTKRGAGELSYRPRYQFPFVVMLTHIINGERMTVRFEPGEDGGTKVSISGKTSKSRHQLAADPELWTEALGS